MIVDVVSTDVPHGTVEAVTEVDKSVLHEKENGRLDKELVPNMAIKFGSHEGEGEVENGDINLHRGAVDEWPTPKQIHSFYFIKWDRYYDPKIIAKITQVDEEIITKKNNLLIYLRNRRKAKMDDRSKLIMEKKPLKRQFYEYNNILVNSRAGRDGALCSSEEELNELIFSLKYHIEHESIPLSEEKQVLREIKQLERTREKVIANAAMRVQKEAIHKHMNVDMDTVRKEQNLLRSKLSSLDKKIKALDVEIESINKELKATLLKRNEGRATVRKLREQNEEGNSLFHCSRGVMKLAKDLAASKDVQALEQLCQAEGEKFMSLWNNDKSFRDDYEKRILSSLERRQLSRDGRIRDPDEKQLVASEAPVPYELEPVAKAVKKPEEAKLEANNEKVQKVSEKKISKTAPEQIQEVEEEVAGLEVEQKTTTPSPVDEAKLKELKREEEIAKAKLAMERKKKLAEKATAKAAKRAEKEAEKKLKEREKKLKKKAGGASVATNKDGKEAKEVEPSELDSTEEAKDAAAAPVKENVKMENPVRYRNRIRGLEAPPRALLKRRKSTNYLLWAVTVVILVVLLVLLGCYCLI